MSGVETVEVQASEDGMRLDRWFKAHYPKLGHGALQRLLRTGQVRLDGSRAKANARIAEGQMVRVPPMNDGPPAPKPDVPREDAAMVRDLVVHRDKSVLALNKPSGLAVQGGTKTERHIDGMLDALTFEAKERPRLVHRLDRDTSGVLLLGRTRKATTALAKSFQSRRTQKTYWALVAGVPRPERGRISLPLVKAGRAGEQRMVVAGAHEDGAQNAETVYQVVDRAGNRFSWLALSPLTGRTHQLRVHMAEIGHPIVGDTKYGGEEADPGEGIEMRLHLHARELLLDHPDGGELAVSAPLPAHMARSWSFLGFSENDPMSQSLFDVMS